MPLLWVIRDVIGLTGTKYGCGVAQCGACTVHIDGAATRSCITQVGDVTGAVTTIEGLSANGDHPIQWPGPSITCRNAATARAAR
jgi:isoquinoline 1-oxidoreductase alpha subunit